MRRLFTSSLTATTAPALGLMVRHNWADEDAQIRGKTDAICPLRAF